MKIIRAHNLACPIDGQKLEAHDKQYVCENGHSFDIARQGYVNLLPVQHKRSRQPGDSKKMVTARTEFLDSGVYQPIADRLSGIILSQIIDGKETCLMDAGCGEGYYLEHVFSALKNVDGEGTISFVGLDISKEAIISATKRNRKISWIVGTNRQPPVTDSSVDIIMCVFGFQSYEGFNKVLKDGGIIILVEPGPDHLKELREIIYSDIKISETPDLSNIKEINLSVIDTQQLLFKTSVDSHHQINNLLTMTPHLFRANKQGKEKAGRLKQLEITVDVIFRTLQKQQ